MWTTTKFNIRGWAARSFSFLKTAKRFRASDTLNIPDRSGDIQMLSRAEKRVPRLNRDDGSARIRRVLLFGVVRAPISSYVELIASIVAINIPQRSEGSLDFANLLLWFCAISTQNRRCVPSVWIVTYNYLLSTHNKNLLSEISKQRGTNKKNIEM